MTISKIPRVQVPSSALSDVQQALDRLRVQINSKLPIQLVTVALNGAGDFDSLKDAIDSISDASAAKPYGVVVFPGVFVEQPITLKPFISISAAARGSVLVEAADDNAPLFTFSFYSTLKDMSIIGPANEACCSVPPGASNCQVENLQIHSGLIGIRCAGAGSGVVLEECKCFPGVTDMLVAESAGRIDASNVLSFAVGDTVRADGGTVWVHNSGCIGSANGLHAENGGTIYPHSFTCEGCVNAMTTGAGVNTISGDAVSSRFTVSRDLWQQSAGSMIDVSSAQIDITLVEAADWSTIHMDYSGTEEGEQAHVFTETLVVGLPELGHDANFGEGLEYTRGMIVITTDDTASAVADGGNLTDVSAAARSLVGSTFTFQGVDANHTILIGSSLSDGSDVLRHWGLQVAQTIAAVELVKRSFAFEIWTGAAWEQVGSMATSVGDSYRYANEVFIRTNTIERIQYGIGLSHGIGQNWTKKTIDGRELYWSRIRITDDLTTAPVFEQFRLLPGHMQVNAYGRVEFVGTARFESTIIGLGNIFGESGGVAGGSRPVGAGGLPTGWNHSIKNSVLNGDGDAIYTQFPIPAGTDTSYPVGVKITLVAVGGAVAPDIDVIMSVLPVEVEGVKEADPAGGTIPVSRTLANTETLTAKAATAVTASIPSDGIDKMRRIEFEPFDISDYYEDDELLLRFELDDDGGGLADLYVFTLAVESAKWTNGGAL